MNFKNMLGSKAKVEKLQGIAIAAIPILLILNFTFVMHIGRPSTEFLYSTPDNYLLLYLTKLIFQILYSLLCAFFVFLSFFNKRSKFIGTNLFSKIIVVLLLVISNLPSIYNYSLLPRYAQGVIATEANEFILFTKRFDHSRRSVFASYSYRNYLKINGKEFELNNFLFNKLNCPKGAANTLWSNHCDKKYQFYFIDYEEGLLDLKEI